MYFYKAELLSLEITQIIQWHFYIFNIKKHVDWAKKLHKHIGTVYWRGNRPALMKR